MILPGAYKHHKVVPLHDTYKQSVTKIRQYQEVILRYNYIHNQYTA